MELTPETVEHKQIDTEHDIIDYEHAQRLNDQTWLQTIAENSPQTFEQPNDNLVVSTNTNDEYRVEPDKAAIDDTELTSTSDKTQVTSRNNSTR